MMLKIIVKYAAELGTATRSVPRCIETHPQSGGAIVCHQIDDDADEKEQKKPRLEAGGNAKKTKHEAEKKDNDKHSEDVLVVEIHPNRIDAWCSAAAERANEDAIHRAVGDIPHPTPTKLSSSEKMFLLQAHITSVLFGIIRQHCAEQDLLDSDDDLNEKKDEKSSSNNHNNKSGTGKKKTDDSSSSNSVVGGKKQPQTKAADMMYARLCDMVELTPIHDEDEVNKLWDDVVSFPSVDKLHDYFGDGVTTYYLWMQFYTKSLLVPAAIGFIIFSYNKATGETVATNRAVPIFSLFVVFWAIVFAKMWSRKSSAHSLKHHSIHVASTEKVRPAFRGKFVRNETTQEFEKYYPWHLRFRQQCISWTVTMMMVAGAMVVQVCSLNLQGYMRGSAHIELEIEWLSQFAETGAIFDPETWLGMVPIIGHCSFVMLLNEIYKRVAWKLTELENWRTHAEHNTSWVQKRLFFEFLDVYAVLFYVAFYRLDIIQLRTELVSLFCVDQIRRLGTETILPLVLKLFFSERDARLRLISRKRQSERTNAELVYYTENALREFEGVFDDMLEMMIGQMGLIVLFASAMPIAALSAVVSNLVEMRSDLYKMCFLTRRPLVIKQRGNEPWDSVQKMLVYSAALTNSILFGFTSDQLSFFAPQIFDPVTRDPLPGRGRDAVGLVFLLEHVVLLLVLAYDHFVPDMDEGTTSMLRSRKIKYSAFAYSNHGVVATAAATPGATTATTTVSATKQQAENGNNNNHNKTNATNTNNNGNGADAAAAQPAGSAKGSGKKKLRKA